MGGLFSWASCPWECPIAVRDERSTLKKWRLATASTSTSPVPALKSGSAKARAAQDCLTFLDRRASWNKQGGGFTEDALLETSRSLLAYFWCWPAPAEWLTWAASGRASMTLEDFSSLFGLPWPVPLLHDEYLACQQGTDRKGKIRWNGVTAESSCPALASNHLILSDTPTLQSNKG